MSALLSDAPLLSNVLSFDFCGHRVNASKIHRRILAQYEGRCTNGWKGSKLAEQASSMKTTWAGQPPHEEHTILTKLMFWFRRMDYFH
jgi:hypothetical protein